MDISDKTVIRLDKGSLELIQEKYLLESKYRTKEDDMNKHKTDKYQFRMQNKKLALPLEFPHSVSTPIHHIANRVVWQNGV